MKERLKFIFAATVLCSTMFLTTTSCNSSDDSDETQQSTYFFKCKINGANFEVTTHLSDFDGTNANIGGQQVDPADQRISLINLFAGNLASSGAGTFTPGSTTEALFRDVNGTNYYYQSGSFEITDFNAANSTVRGGFSSITFSSGAETLVATEGSFYVYMFQ